MAGRSRRARFCLTAARARGANSPGSPAGLIDPLLEYDHTAGTAVIGGFVYHGTLLPQLDGDYIFGDLSNGSANGRLFYSNLSHRARSTNSS